MIIKKVGAQNSISLKRIMKCGGRYNKPRSKELYEHSDGLPGIQENRGGNRCRNWGGMKTCDVRKMQSKESLAAGRYNEQPKGTGGGGSGGGASSHRSTERWRKIEEVEEKAIIIREPVLWRGWRSNEGGRAETLKITGDERFPSNSSYKKLKGLPIRTQGKMTQS